MKVVRAVLLVAVMASSLVVIATTEALACSCIPPRPDKEAIKDAAAVFTGTMVEADVAEPGFTPGTWTFAVDSVFKGVDADRVEVTSHTQSAACGLIFKEEKRYVVFAHRENGKLQTNSCTNTRPIGNDEVLAAEAFGLAERTETRAAPPLVEDVEQPSPNLTPIVVGGASVLLVAGLAALALKRKRAGG